MSRFAYIRAHGPYRRSPLLILFIFIINISRRISNIGAVSGYRRINFFSSIILFASPIVVRLRSTPNRLFDTDLPRPRTPRRRFSRRKTRQPCVWRMRHYSTFLPIDPFCLQPRAEPRDYASLNSAARQIAAARTRPFALSTQTSSFEVLRPPRSLSPTGLTRSGPAFFVAPCRLRTPQPNSQTQPRVRRVCYACSIALQCRSLRRKSDE